MANEASSSTSPVDAEDEILMLYGSESGWVEPLSHCDHLTSLSSNLTHIPTPDTPCNRCQHPAENWLCLCCKEELCSRFVNKHMLEHYKQSNHSIALSFSFPFFILYTEGRLESASLPFRAGVRLVYILPSLDPTWWEYTG